MTGFVSPRLGVRFDTSGAELAVYHPNGRPFLTFEDWYAEMRAAEQRAEEYEQWPVAEQRAAQAHARRVEAERLFARLAELGRKARRQQATPEELAELERLEDQILPPP